MRTLNRSLAICLVVVLTACNEYRPQAEALYAPFVPGEVTQQTGFMRPQTEVFEKFFGQGMRYEVTREVLDGRAVWRVAVLFGEASESNDVMTLDARTLALLGRRLVMPDYTLELKLQDGHLSGELTPTAGSSYRPVRYDKRYPHAVFEPALINFAIASLPLDHGFTASIPTLDLTGETRVHWSDVQVLAQETLTLDGVPVPCWKVRASGLRDKTLWITVDSRRTVRMRTGGNWGDWTLQNRAP